MPRRLNIVDRLGNNALRTDEAIGNNPRCHGPRAVHPADAGISTITSLRRRKGSVQGGL
jgi:hypothetical protein